MLVILRLNHRISRDKRLTTHVALTARAFGASKLYYTGQKDSEFEDSIKSVVDRVGGSFEIEFIKDYKPIIKSKKIIHLTVYGLPLEKEITKIKKFKDILVIVGGAKVQPEFYNISDYNISVSQQPISEVSALAIFLYKYFNGKYAEFKNPKLKVIPQARGKLVKSK